LGQGGIVTKIFHKGEGLPGFNGNFPEVHLLAFRTFAEEGIGVFYVPVRVCPDIKIHRKGALIREFKTKWFGAFIGQGNLDKDGVAFQVIDPPVKKADIEVKLARSPK
jgi:hypothetical protein